MKRLMGFGDHRTSNIVAKIAEEEVAHVAVGVDWFLSVCQKMNRAPCPTFKGTDIQLFSCMLTCSFYTIVMSIFQPHVLCRFDQRVWC